MKNGPEPKSQPNDNEIRAQLLLSCAYYNYYCPYHHHHHASTIIATAITTIISIFDHCGDGINNFKNIDSKNDLYNPDASNGGYDTVDQDDKTEFIMINCFSIIYIAM